MKEETEDGNEPVVDACFKFSADAFKALEELNRKLTELECTVGDDDSLAEAEKNAAMKFIAEYDRLAGPLVEFVTLYGE